MKRIKIPIQAESDDIIPVYGSEKASGADVRANIEEDVILEPGESILIPTGLKVDLPDGYEIQIRPRSGLAYKHQITVLNTPGTIDTDYRGEIGIILINHGKKAFTITSRMRIAQAVLAPVIQAEFVHREKLSTSVRGEGGFGHTGTH